MTRIGISGAVLTALTIALIFCSSSYGDQGQALIEAVRNNDLKQVQGLLTKGADINAKVHRGLSALAAAQPGGDPAAPGTSVKPGSTLSPEQCDDSAKYDLLKLKAALERLRHEIKDLGCEPKEVIAKFAEPGSLDFVAYLIGPYYGWAGANRRAEVKIKLVGDEIHACAAKGEPKGPTGEDRTIYRIGLFGGPDLPPIFGPCDGKTLGSGPEEDCYVSSLLDTGCLLIKPQTVKCKTLLKE